MWAALLVPKPGMVGRTALWSRSGRVTTIRNPCPHRIVSKTLSPRPALRGINPANSPLYFFRGIRGILTLSGRRQQEPHYTYTLSGAFPRSSKHPIKVRHSLDTSLKRPEWNQTGFSVRPQSEIPADDNQTSRRGKRLFARRSYSVSTANRER